MASIRGTARLVDGNPPPEGTQLEVHLPTFAYRMSKDDLGEPGPNEPRPNEPGPNAPGQTARAPERHLVSTSIGRWRSGGADPQYGVEVPGESIVGSDGRLFAAWVAVAGIDEIGFTVDVAVRGADDELIAVRTLQVLFFVDEQSKLSERAGSVLTQSLSRRLFLVNATEYWRLRAELDEAYPGADVEDGAGAGGSGFGLLALIAEIGNLAGGVLRLRPLSDDDISAIADRRGIAPDLVRQVIKRFDALTTFDVEIPVPEPLELAGTFAVTGQSEISRRDLGLYHPVIDVPVLTAPDDTTLRSIEPGWPEDADPTALPTRFRWSPSPPVLRSAIAGPVTVRLKGFDGSVLWRASYPSTDETLGKLKIVVDRYEPRPAPSVDVPQSGEERRIRGQVVSLDPARAVGSLTVIIQARLADDVNWRLVSAGQTDASGYFAVPYPTGPYVAAQAVVSAAPDAPTDIPIVTADAEGSTLSDGFLYLMLHAGGPAAAEDDCGCEKHIGRLPDQADLIRSGEFTQDLGGGCVNVTTPNRTLREYAFTAIVRASDPDVVSYTLKRTVDGRFALIGSAAKVDRGSVDLHNPIRWQDAPASGDALNFYQAVTVATGHVLHFKAVFKADGYSLGDLVYSLPLAPGQKKQIVSYDVANTLEASETQRLAQGERVAAGLTDDRQITDELTGGITEAIGGRSKAHTSGMSAGLGAAGSIGAISGSLGVAGGFANSSSSASQNGARGISQYFGERLRQALTQNAEAYRELNASVVTTVRDGQEYAVTTEVVANHNHCHALTMMYFEVLRHYAISQELADVQECLFVPLLLTEFTPEKVARWKDVLSVNMLAVPAATYLQPFALRLMGARRHPLLGAFDALDRVQTNWTRVDYPLASYAEEAVTSISGEFQLRTYLPRPRTRFDRIMSLPITSETRTSERVDMVSTVAAAIFSGGASLLFGPSTDTVSEQVLVRQQIFDLFMELDANFQTARPADCIRVMRFQPQVYTAPDGTVSTLTFFQNDEDRRQWAAYATLLGLPGPEAMLEQYFAGKLVSEWDAIFNRDIAPRLFTKVLDTIRIQPLNLDFTAANRYNGGERSMRIRGSGGSHAARASMPDRMRMYSTSAAVHAIREFTTLDVDNVTLRYTTAHFDGVLHRGFAGGDLLDADPAITGVQLATPLTSQDKRNPRQEDRYLADELVTHLNAHLEHYNKALWRGLDEDRRFMLLDGFSIETYDATGLAIGMRSLASVVKHELLDIAGNALVFPVADGYRVSQSMIVEDADRVRTSGLREQYQPTEPVPPYRLSVPTRGVYMESVLGACDSCEAEKPNSSQDWDEFRTDEPTAIQAVTTPTPERFDWRAAWTQFASPIVAMQTPRELPAPGAGLAGLSDALTKAEAFRDVTGLAGNQANVMKTFLSNQENARAFAEMAKSMAMQQHNSENSDQIMQSLGQARESGALSESDYQQMVRDHLGQRIDGGARRTAEDRADEVRQPSLTNAAIQAVEEGRAVSAARTEPDGTTESVEVQPPGQVAFASVHYDVPLVPQPNKTSCWAAAMAMVESYHRSQERQASVVVTAAELAAEVGYSLEQSYGWDRLESVKDHFEFDEIPLSGTQYPTAQQWHEWLSTRGPLYVTVGGTPTHAIIVHGISGDGTPGGTHLEILNPWDINATFDANPTEFHPPNQGAQLRLTVTELGVKLNEGELDTLVHYENWRLLYQPANAPSGSTPAPTGAPSPRAPVRTCRIKALNRYLQSDPRVAYKVSIISAVFNLELSVTGTGWKNVTDPVPDGDHALVVTPVETATEPADWAAFANPVAGTPVADRIWLEERATVTVTGGRVTAVSGNPQVTLRGSDLTVKLRPLWTHTPHHGARAGNPTLIVVHHTAGSAALPASFLGLGAESVSAHYVIPKDGNVIKLADEQTEVTWHAGASRWKTLDALNDHAIGIEVVHMGVTDSYQPAQITALVALLGQLRARFPAITAHDVIAHSDCGVNAASGTLGRKLTDPGIQMEWPTIEAAGHATEPATAATTFVPGPVNQIYHRFFESNPARRMQPRADHTHPLHANVDAAHRELKSDLTAIGYHIPAASRTNGEYDDATARAVAAFMDRYFSGARRQPIGFYSWNVGFETAQMIKRVLKAVTP